MAYKQVRAFNRSKAGTTKNLCLRNVRLGYDIAPKYDNATEAWNNTQQHRVRTVPMGIDVPLFYSYTVTLGGVRKNYGHINVRLANGQIWSDGEIFASIDQYEAQRAPIYVGWGESINGVRVIEHVADTPSLPAPTGGSFRVNPGFKFRVYKPGTTTIAGVIDHSWGWYKKRGVDPQFPNRWMFHSNQLGLCSFPWADVKMRPYTGEYSEIK